MLLDVVRPLLVGSIMSALASSIGFRVYPTWVARLARLGSVLHFTLFLSIRVAWLAPLRHSPMRTFARAVVPFIRGDFHHALDLESITMASAPVPRAGTDSTNGEGELFGALASPTPPWWGYAWRLGAQATCVGMVAFGT